MFMKINHGFITVKVFFVVVVFWHITIFITTNTMVKLWLMKQNVSVMYVTLVLMEGTETLCRDDIGIYLEAQSSLTKRNANEYWLVEFAYLSHSRAHGYK